MNIGPWVPLCKMQIEFSFTRKCTLVQEYLFVIYKLDFLLNVDERDGR